jgi:4-amino-4-deoxy-L-arabinose transferase-like glycosyltransferase
MNLTSPFGRNTFYFLIALILIHLGFGFLLNFSVDEAHYALYGLKLDWSYFDHPPMVGWIQALPVYLGAPDGILRFIPEALWLGTIILTRKNTEKIIQLFGHYPQSNTIQLAKNWSTVCIMAAPILHVLAVGLLPDTLVIFLVAAMIYIGLQLHEQLSQFEINDFSWWLLLGIVFGLAGLSKYTAVFFAIAIAICLINWHGVSIFKRPGLWVAIIIAGIMITPVIYWNSKNEWISFIYQLNHGTGGEWKIRRVGVFLLNQFVTYGFLPFLGLWLAIKYRSLSTYNLLVVFLLPFVLFAYISGGGGSLPHWTSPAWVSLIPISSFGLAKAWESGKLKLISTLLIIQGMICLVGFILLWSGGIPTISKDDPLGKKNPIADLYGWPEAGAKAKALAQSNSITHLAVQNWTLGSRLAWYARPMTVHILDQRFDQFDMWFGDLPNNASAIVVNWTGMSFSPPTQEGQFSSCEKLENMPIKRQGRIISEFEFMICHEWQSKKASTDQNKGQ